MAANHSDLRRGIEAELRDIADPLMKRLSDVDEWMETHIAQLNDLRAIRREIVTVLRPLVGEDRIPVEPGRNAKPGPPKGSTRAKSNYKAGDHVSDELVTDVLAFLRENYNGTTFNSFDVKEGLPDRGSQSHLGKVLVALLEREQIVLDRVAPREPGMKGTTKHYRLVQ